MLVYGGMIAVAILSVWRRYHRLRAGERRALASDGAPAPAPAGQHPRIDVTRCIGCGACADACPEGEVLGLVGGKAAILEPARCIGHGLCAEACPVGAIEIVTAPPAITAGLPRLTPDYETSVPLLFVAGELGGLSLIKNAVVQGRACVDTIAARLGPARGDADFDVCIVGAGPAGLSASLRALERRLRYVTFEQGELGGTVAKYPRQKLVLTSPVEWPVIGRFAKLAISKEELLRLWARVHRDTGLRVHAGERVVSIVRDAHGVFTVLTERRECRVRAVVLAIGRRGTPRTLGVPGEALPKVMYSLLDAAAYRDARILVVGGGDSAVEAALGLAHQRGNRVTLAYRGSAFTRIKERNARRVRQVARDGRLELLFGSQVRSIAPESVTLDVGGGGRSLANDFVWIFAGSIPATALLETAGVAVGPQDLTRDARAAARDYASRPRNSAAAASAPMRS